MRTRKRALHHGCCRVPVNWGGVSQFYCCFGQYSLSNVWANKNRTWFMIHMEFDMRLVSVQWSDPICYYGNDFMDCAFFQISAWFSGAHDQFWTKVHHRPISNSEGMQNEQNIGVPSLVSMVLDFVLIKCVKCYHSGRKIDFIPSICEIPWQTWYHCIQYTKRHHESILTFVAPFLPDLAYLSMLFILEVLCTACNAEHIKNK